MGAQARFFARVAGNMPREMTSIFVAAEHFKGTALIEVLQNCVIFNDGCFDAYTDKAVREDRQLFVEHGKPMLFGKDRDKGLVLNGLKLEVVTVGEGGVPESKVLVHDAHQQDPTLHQIRSFRDTTLEERKDVQTRHVRKHSEFRKADDLFFSGETYEVS